MYPDPLLPILYREKVGHLQARNPVNSPLLAVHCTELTAFFYSA